MWWRPETEGCMICKKYVIKLHSIGKRHAGAGDVIGHQLICSSGSRSMDENASCKIDLQMNHSLDAQLCHFVPMPRKTQAPKKPVYISQIHY